jgi:hypothetical protein
VQPGNYVHDDFADVYDLVSPSNALRTARGKTCQVLLGKVFKAMMPARQLVIYGAGLMPAFDSMAAPQQVPPKCTCCCRSFRGTRIRQKRLAIGQPGRNLPTWRWHVSYYWPSTCRSAAGNSSQGVSRSSAASQGCRN